MKKKRTKQPPLSFKRFMEASKRVVDDYFKLFNDDVLLENLKGVLSDIKDHSSYPYNTPLTMTFTVGEVRDNIGLLYEDWFIDDFIGGVQARSFRTFLIEVVGLNINELAPEMSILLTQLVNEREMAQAARVKPKFYAYREKLFGAPPSRDSTKLNAFRQRHVERTFGSLDFLLGNGKPAGGGKPN